MEGVSCRGILGDDELMTNVVEHISNNGMFTEDGRQRLRCSNVFVTDELSHEVFPTDNSDTEYMGLQITADDISALMAKGLYSPKSADDQGRKVEGALAWIKLQILSQRGYIKLGSLCVRRQDVSASRLFLAALLKWDRSKEEFCQEIDKLLIDSELSIKGTTKQESTIKLV
jgi:hypothetical protein